MVSNEIFDYISADEFDALLDADVMDVDSADLWNVLAEYGF